MVQAENIDSGISNSQLANCSGRDHHSLVHLGYCTDREFDFIDLLLSVPQDNKAASASHA